jgi:hypothetical protein
MTHEQKLKNVSAAVPADAGAKSQTSVELKALRMLGEGSKPIDIMSNLDRNVTVMQKILADYEALGVNGKERVEIFYLRLRSTLGRTTSTTQTRLGHTAITASTM